MSTRATEYAFPGQGFDRDERGLVPYPERGGMTKRELFAAMAMQGLLAEGVTVDNAVKIAVEAADALIAELDKPEPG